MVQECSFPLLTGGVGSEALMLERFEDFRDDRFLF